MKDIFIKKLKEKGIFVTEESRINNCGDQLKLSNLAILNIFDSGKWNVQGKNASQTKAILEEAQIAPASNNKVFVVYGHDLIARTQLEAMLRSLVSTSSAKEPSMNFLESFRNLVR